MKMYTYDKIKDQFISMNETYGQYFPQKFTDIANKIDLYSESILMQDILKKISEIANTDQHVIIIGEIGTGKKQIAKFIHSKSEIRLGPFHIFYCIDIDESEYKEAFWEQIHVDDDHITLKYDALEKAGHGILFLDQFSELSHQYMLEIIESYISGCNQLFRYNHLASPRIILSVNQERFQTLNKSDTWKKILNMLNPISIMLPPLRERKEDIPAMINLFLEELKTIGEDWNNLEISEEAVEECQNYNWPGNIRQLKNAIIQGAILSHGKVITSKHFPFSMKWKLPYSTDSD